MSSKYYDSAVELKAGLVKFLQDIIRINTSLQFRMQAKIDHPPESRAIEREHFCQSLFVMPNDAVDQFRDVG